MKYLSYLLVTLFFLIHCDTTTTIVQKYEPWIVLDGDFTIELMDPSDYVEPGFTCTDTEDGILTDSVIITWYRLDKTTPFTVDSVKIDSAAYIQYLIVDSDNYTNIKWRLLKFTGPFQSDLPWIFVTDTLDTTFWNSDYYFEQGFSCLSSNKTDITDSVETTWYRTDKITPFNPDSAIIDSAAYLKYTIKENDTLTDTKWRLVKFSGPFKSDFPWIVITDTLDTTFWNKDYYFEQGYTCISSNKTDITDSVKTSWYRKDKVTPFDPDSAIIDSAAYLKYYVKENDSLTDTKWRLVKFSGPFSQDIYDPDISTFTQCIKPNTFSQNSMDSSVIDMYEYWKQKYVKASVSTPDGYYVFSGGGTGATDSAITVSEAQGFGMLITALMADKDSSAKQIFDGMYKFYRAHPCSDNPLLMAWEVLENSAGEELGSDQVTSYSNTSATDGDIDIAYGLLLAHTLWGSDGDINYLQAADSLINYAIKGEEVGINTKRTLLGSWDVEKAFKTRPSDWMPGEFHAFAELTGETYWNDVVDTLYSIADHIIYHYAPMTALVPDFVINEIPKPAPPKFLEWTYDGEYYNNACRVPMRIMTDVAHYQDESSIKWMMKVAHWITKKTDNNPENIQAGYYIFTGENIRDWDNVPAYVSPFVVCATVSSEHQDFVNKGWELIKDYRSNYYNDCINLMCMLQISGNWWKPEL